MKEWLADAASEPDDFNALVELRTIADDVFDDEEWYEVQERFLEAAQDALEEGGLDEDELDGWQDAADELGVGLDEYEMELARASITTADAPYEPDERQAAVRGSAEVENGEDQIDALISRLRER